MLELHSVIPALTMRYQMSRNLNRRQISGDRVVCQCSLELPKIDPFTAYKVFRKGIIVLNVRGGSLYLAQQFNEQSIGKVFKPNTPATIKNFVLLPENSAPIKVGNIVARFLRFKKGDHVDGMVLRFSQLSEEQMDLLNNLPNILPVASGDEEKMISPDQLQRL